MTKRSQSSSDEENDSQIIQESQKRRRYSTASQQSVSQHLGVIKSIELINFMCHKYLKVNLGSQINFIIGHNGSGKSAILTALTVCLGGKAQATNRGSKMSDLILEGQQSAEVLVKLKNSGNDGYKPETFGNVITIIRRINRDGSSGYKLKSEDGKIVSARKEELNAICDHFNIQPENPLLILSQDAARQFLSASTAEDRYKMFLRGTQLQQLADYYQQIKESILQYQESLQLKLKTLPELKEDLKKAQIKVKEMEAAAHLEERIFELKQQIAWSQVYDCEKRKDEQLAAKEQVEYKIDKCQLKISEEEEKQKELRNEKSQIDEKMENLGQEMIRLENEKSYLEEKQEKFIQQTRILNQEHNEINQDLNEKKRTVENWQSKIQDEEEKKNIVMFQKQKEQRIQTIKEKRELIQSKTEQYALLSQQIRNMDPELNESSQISQLQRQRKLLQDQYLTKNSQLDELKRHVRDLEGQKDLFGDSLKVLLNEIQARAGNFKSFLPIGPIAKYCRIRDSKWKDVFDAIFSLRFGYSFIVGCPEDANLLRKLFIECRWFQATQHGKIKQQYEIICLKKDPLFSRDLERMKAKSTSHYRCALDEILFKEELVMQACVNSFKLESIILVENRDIGERIMTPGNFPPGVQQCFDQRVNQIGHQRGRVNTNKRRGKSSPGAYHLSELVIQDVKERILRLKMEIKDQEESLLHLKEQLEACDSDLRVKQVHLNADKQKSSDLQNDIRKLQDQVDKLQDLLDNMNPVDESMLLRYRDILQTEQEQLEQLQNKAQLLAEKKKELKEEIQLLQSSKEEFDQQIQKLKRKGEDWVEKVKEIEKFNLQIISDLNHYKQRLSDYQQQLEQETNQFEQLKREFEENYQLAYQYCESNVIEKQDLQMTTSQLERQLLVMEKRLQEQEEEEGSLEIALDHYQRCLDSYKKSKRDALEMDRMLQLLQQTYQERVSAWIDLRSAYSQRSSMQFQHLLEKRNYRGKLTFQHEQKKLILFVETEQTQQAQRNNSWLSQPSQPVSKKNKRSANKDQQYKDPRGLSGGERSFSTVCLLLALWEAMGSPFRGLDEFDVFMDSVNRKISMSMMMANARSHVNKQYVFITPQAIENVDIGPDTKIIRLNDPERRWQLGQRTLNEML